MPSMCPPLSINLSGARPKEEPILSPYYAHIGHTRCDERQAISGHKKIPADGLEYW